MGVLEFFGGVWVSIIFGIFFIAMVVGCTYDRHYAESPKWWIAGVAVITLLVWQWDGNMSWSDRWYSFWSVDIWKYVGYYVLIGLGYSIIEFMLEVRRSARYWEKTWASYRSAFRDNQARNAKIREQAEREFAEQPLNQEEGPLESIGNALTGRKKAKVVQPVPDEEFGENQIRDFLSRHGSERYYNLRIIGVTATEDGKGIEPKVNRQQLAESVGCWTIFWPFYAVSLIIGDLVTELFRVVADVLASMSGRFVRRMFKDVFKF